MPSEQGHWYKRPEDRNRVVVRLTCGHDIRIRAVPHSRGAKFHCVQGTGCGYMLGWVKWTDLDNGHSGVNPKFKDT